MQVYKAPGGGVVKAWVDGVPIESAAIDQLKRMADLPFIYKHVAAMPDTHVGIGATIGSVIPTRKAIIPSAVGVDIGCGMVAVPTNLTANSLPDNLDGVRSAIEEAIPTGQPTNGKPKAGIWDYGSMPDEILRVFERGRDRGDSGLSMGLENLLQKHPGMVRGKTAEGVQTALTQLSTLGGGNHFIEVCLDQAGLVWVMLHSGSRGIGNKLGTYFIELAKKDMERWFVKLPDSDLAYFPTGTPHFNDYWDAVNWAQDYARVNREVMVDYVIRAMNKALAMPVYYIPSAVVSCHHNYVALENHFGTDVYVTRKGSIRARKGDLGIIPGSMGTHSYIVRGLGNPDSFMSAAHGAGRAMSRSVARKTFTIDDHELATQGIACRKDAGVLDESPGAYKPIEAVMAAQTDLVETLYELRQVVCIKG